MSPPAKPASLKPMTDTQRGWLAGVLEGEGYFHSAKQGDRSYPRIAVTMCDLDVLVRLQEVTGVGTIDGPHKTRSDKHTPTYQWRVQRKNDAIAVMRLVSPMMGTRRQARIEAVLSGIA